MSEITVASTTDPQEAVDEAAGVEPASDQPEPPQAAQDAPPEEPIQEQQAAPVAEVPAQQPQRPQRGDYQSDDQFVEALTDWKAGQRLQQQKQAEIAQAEEARVRQVMDTYDQAAQSARKKYPDFEKVVGRSDLKIPQAAQLAIIESGSVGPDIAYYLGKHPEVCAELIQMSPSRAVAKIGQIELKVTKGKEKEQQPTPAVGRMPPAPITPVGGSSSRSSVPLGELPYRDYKRLRDQEERNNRN